MVAFRLLADVLQPKYPLGERRVFQGGETIVNSGVVVWAGFKVPRSGSAADRRSLQRDKLVGSHLRSPRQSPVKWASFFDAI